MQLRQIEFNGYKRLRRAACNVDSKTIAFIGPNEVGKSSVLKGLAWLTTDADDAALPARELNRAQRPDGDALIVRAIYRLDASDIEALGALDLDTDQEISLDSISEFRLSRKQDGTVVTGLTSSLSRNRAPFEAGFVAASKAREDIAAASDVFEHIQVEPPLVSLRESIDALTPGDLEWTSSRTARLRDAATELELLVSEIASHDVRSRPLTAARRSAEKAMHSLRTAAEAGDRRAKRRSHCTAEARAEVPPVWRPRSGARGDLRPRRPGPP